MPGSVTINPRKIYVEDIDFTTTRGETTSATILGAGSQTVTKVDVYRLSDLTAAANDAAAASAGVIIGQHYYNTTYNKPWTRMA